MKSSKTGNNEIYISYLKKILHSEKNNLRSAVAKEAIGYDNIENFFTDLMKHGCVSGMINSLIYYKDTHHFYDTHYDEIETLREDAEENVGEPLKIEGDMKNFFAWFAFEETASTI